MRTIIVILVSTALTTAAAAREPDHAPPFVANPLIDKAKQTRAEELRQKGLQDVRGGGVLTALAAPLLGGGIYLFTQVVGPGSIHPECGGRGDCAHFDGGAFGGGVFTIAAGAAAATVGILLLAHGHREVKRANALRLGVSINGVSGTF